MRVSCHITFDGQCGAAFRAYQSILGGTLATLLTFGDSPLAAQVPAEWAGRILHATLSLDGQDLLGSDAFPGAAVQPAGFAVTLGMEDAAQAGAVFTRLAEGGQVVMPLQPTFWASAFGVVRDRWGVTWELNCATPADAQDADVVDVLERFYAAVNRNDMAALVQDFDPAIVRVEPDGFPSAGTYHGIAAVQAHVAQGRGTWAEGRCDPELYLAHGDKVVVDLHAHVRRHGATEWIGGRFADGFVVRGGRIVEYRTFGERAAARRWAGIAVDGAA